MNLLVFLPGQRFLDQAVVKVTAEDPNGFFCLLPRHVDWVTNLVPGLMFYETEEGSEEFLAVNGGTLVKCGQQVSVATRNAARGPDLGSVYRTVREQYRVMGEEEKRAQSALTSLQANLMNRVFELEYHGPRGL